MWLKEHFLTALIGLTVALAAVYKSGIVQWLLRSVQTIRATERELTAAAERRAQLRETERDAALGECEELKRLLADRLREDAARDDIHRQARATIRALKRLLDERGIDYSEVEDGVRQTKP